MKTTEGMLLRDLLQEAAALGRPLFTLFDHPAGVGASFRDQVWASALPRISFLSGNTFSIDVCPFHGGP